jgi:hypothetical protein
MVWVIAQEQSETYGHGDFGISWKLPTIDAYDTGDFHPGFLSEHAAMTYIASLPPHHRLMPVRINIKE